MRVLWKSDFLTSQARAGFFRISGSCFSKGVTFYVARSVNNVSCVQCVFFIFAIIAFYGIGRILVLLRFFSHHRLLQHRPGYWFFSVLNVSLLLLETCWFFCRIKILTAYIGFFKDFKKKLTDIGSFDGSSQTLDLEFFGFNQDFG